MMVCPFSRLVGAIERLAAGRASCQLAESRSDQIASGAKRRLNEWLDRVGHERRSAAPCQLPWSNASAATTVCGLLGMGISAAHLVPLAVPSR